VAFLGEQLVFSKTGQLLERAQKHPASPGMVEKGWIGGFGYSCALSSRFVALKTPETLSEKQPLNQSLIQGQLP